MLGTQWLPQVQLTPTLMPKSDIILHLCREARETPAPLVLLGRMAWQEPLDQQDHPGPLDPPGLQDLQDQDFPWGL